MEWSDAYGELDAAIKDSTLIKESKDVAGLAKQTHDLLSWKGGAIRIPGENASDADKKDFTEKLKKVGMIPKDKFTDFVKPEKADEYKYDGDLPEGMTIAENELTSWKTRAHALGLSNDQFINLVKSEIDGRVGLSKTRREALETANGKLKQEWGTAFDQKIVLAEQAALWGGGEEFRTAVMQTREPAMLAFLAKVGESLQESTRTDIQRRFTQIDTPAEARSKIAEIEGNKSHPWHRLDSLRSAEKAVVLAEMMSLRSRAMGLKPGKDFMFDEVG